MKSLLRVVFVALLLVPLLGIGVAFGQNAQTFQFQNQQVRPADLNQLTIASFGGCDTAATADKRSTVFERAEAARAYESCMRTTFSQVQVAQSQTGNMVAANAITNLQSAVLTEASLQLESAEAAESFMGLSWGLGFGYSIATDDIIESAEIVNGVVRATDDRTKQARLLLEFHRFFWCNDKQRSVERGCGPFVAIAASSDDILQGVGVGFMWGWKSKNATDSAGFSVGIGAILDNDVKSLADGFAENQPPPPGETEVRFKKEARWSGLLFVTRTF